MKRWLSLSSVRLLPPGCPSSSTRRRRQRGICSGICCKVYRLLCGSLKRPLLTRRACALACANSALYAADQHLGIHRGVQSGKFVFADEKVHCSVQEVSGKLLFVFFDAVEMPLDCSHGPALSNDSQQWMDLLTTKSQREPKQSI